MANEQNPASLASQRDRQVRLGLILTALWLGAGVLYVAVSTGLDRIPAAAARRPRRFPGRCVCATRLSVAGARAVSAAARTRREQPRDPAPVRGHAAHGRARRDPDARHCRQRAARATGHVHRRGPAGDEPARGDRWDAVHFEPGHDRRRRGVGRGGRPDVCATEFRRVIGLQSTHDPAARAAGRFAGRLGAVLRDADPHSSIARTTSAASSGCCAAPRDAIPKA